MQILYHLADTECFSFVVHFFYLILSVVIFCKLEHTSYLHCLCQYADRFSSALNYGERSCLNTFDASY